MNPLETAECYATAIDSADDDAIRACHVPDARIWHNSDGIEQTVDENLALGRWLRRKVPDIAITEVRNIATSCGFVRLSVMRGTAPDGTKMMIPSCIVAFLDDDGLIKRVEEFLDPAPFAALRTS